MYKLLGSHASRTLRVLWALEEVGAEYEYDPAYPRSPEVLAHNPSGKVPVLLDDGEPIVDSTAIMTYIADKHGALTHPAGTLARARQDAWTQTILDELDAVLWTAARHSFILPDEERVPEIKASLKLEFERNLKRITDTMSGPYLTGDMMTVPDIILAHCCLWAFVAKFPKPPAELGGYLASMQGRPAFERAQALGKTS